jgi:UDP-GlcNAc:undecaprenyl-phosphate/decaprenyl-phosphate GlcNAc-1-phosphate transferase
MTGLFLRQNLFIPLLILLTSLAFTEIVRLISARVGFISYPEKDRWSRRAVSLGGGIAIQLSIIAGFVWLDKSLVIAVLPAFVGVFLLGLIDDLWGTSASGKLIVQAIAASVIAAQGFLLPIPSIVIAMPLTIIWVVGATNALNLIDNMDGLAAGATTIAAISLGFLLHSQGASRAEVTACFVVAAATLGFLVHNFHPARIFMGDAGSLPLGFILAVLSTRLRVQEAGIPVILSILPICFVLLVPLFDTLLVMVARRNAKRPLMSGGRDHTSHRLVSLGLSERKTAILLYILGAVGGIAAWLTLHGSFFEFMVVSIAVVIGATLFGVFLLDVVVYPPPPITEFRVPKGSWKVQPSLSLPIPMRIIVELAIDVGVVSLAWTLAHTVRFYDEGLIQYYQISSVIPTLPFVITAKLIAFSSFRIYRGLWRAVFARDVYRIFKAATLASLLVVAGLVITTRLRDISRVVLLLDWLLTFIALVGTRAAYNALRGWFRKLANAPYKAALLGSPTLASLVQTVTTEEGGVAFAGVISTDGASHHDPSCQILGNAEEVEKIVEEQGIDILLVATDRFDEVLGYLSAKGIMIRQVRIQLT